MARSRVHQFSIFTSSMTFVLILAGAMVTSTGSGLSVPDWPLSYGQWFPPMEGGVLFEHGHRLIAASVASLMAVLCVWIWISPENLAARWVGTTALLIVLFQALLGGMTVLYGLPRWVSIPHAVLAQIFFCLTVTLALLTSPFWDDPYGSQKWPSIGFPSYLKTVSGLASLETGLILIQTFLGAGFRHGSSFPFLKMHVANSVLIAFLGFSISIFVLKNLGKIKIFAGPAVVLGVLLLGQIALGVLTVLPMTGVLFYSASLRTLLVTLHVALGALILASSLTLTLFGFRGYKLKGKMA
ncbi:MAG: COX15/CtaA family protein [Elusimicrobia bacterium]|nr:COX15/CtaA family protein [Elusimicrobiota bacterium]